MKKILFITGTRADYGKIKALMREVQNSTEFELLIFVTGMHMLSKYGSTHTELEKDGFKGMYKYINQTESSSMDIVLSNTILGISNYINEIKVDLIVVHGDRIETLAGAVVGALNNIRVAHIEGGEISGTIDESIRHAVSKFSHIHFVANQDSKRRLIQLGEFSDNIFVIGSPDIDVMLSDSLPSLEETKQKYTFTFNEYAVLTYHPVTTELNILRNNVREVVNAVVDSGENYIVVYPNNDSGSSIILEEYEVFRNMDRVRLFPSIRFEHFLTMLKHAKFVIGNSSVGIREAGLYGTPAIDIGTRQQGRYTLGHNGIYHTIEKSSSIISAIDTVKTYNIKPCSHYGDGNSSTKFIEILSENYIWECDIQKKFVDTE